MEHKRVGASVVVQGDVNSGFGRGIPPPPFGPYQQCYQPCPYPYPVIPPQPIPPIPPIPPVPPILPRRDAGGSFNIGPQTIVEATTRTLVLSGTNFSNGGVSLSGTGVYIPFSGRYIVAVSVNITRPTTSTSGTTFVSITGVSSGGNNIAGDTANPGDSKVLAGSAVLDLVAGSVISVSLADASPGPIIVNGGTLSLQLLT